MNRLVLISSCCIAASLIAFSSLASAQTAAPSATASGSTAFKVKPEGGDRFPGCVKEKKTETSTSGSKATTANTDTSTKTNSASASNATYECVPGCTYNAYLSTSPATLRATKDACSAQCDVASLSAGTVPDPQCEVKCRAGKQCVVQSCTQSTTCGTLGYPCTTRDICQVVSGSALEQALSKAGVAAPASPNSKDALKPDVKTPEEKLKLLTEQQGELQKVWEVQKDAEARCKELPTGGCWADVPKVLAEQYGLGTGQCSGSQCTVEVNRMQSTLVQEQIRLNEEIGKVQTGLTQTPQPDPQKTAVPPPGPGVQQPSPQPSYTYNPGPSTFGNPSGSGSGGGGLGSLGPLMSGLGRALSSIFGGQQCPAPQAAQTCPSDPQQYQQYQQQYQQQIQMYQYQLQQFQYQQQMNARYGYSQQQACPPQPPVPCRQGASNTGGQCQNSPAPTSACSSGWQPVYSGSCVASWRCGSSGSGSAPVAQISCQPRLADIGTTIAISFSCSAGVATGTGFEAGGQQSGSATAIVGTPASGVTTVEYGLTCSDSATGRSSSKTCGVKINKPAIVLVSNPKKVAKGKAATIGWVTAGMDSCVISSPDFSVFTEENKDKPKKSGVAETPELTGSATFVLSCTTLGGGEKEAEVTVEVE